MGLFDFSKKKQETIFEKHEVITSEIEREEVEIITKELFEIVSKYNAAKADKIIFENIE